MTDRISKVLALTWVLLVGSSACSDDTENQTDGDSCGDDAGVECLSATFTAVSALSRCAGPEQTTVTVGDDLKFNISVDAQLTHAAQGTLRAQVISLRASDDAKPLLFPLAKVKGGGYKGSATLSALDEGAQSYVVRVAGHEITTHVVVAKIEKRVSVRVGPAVGALYPVIAKVTCGDNEALPGQALTFTTLPEGKVSPANATSDLAGELHATLQPTDGKLPVRINAESGSARGGCIVDVAGSSLGGSCEAWQ